MKTRALLVTVLTMFILSLFPLAVTSAQTPDVFTEEVVKVDLAKIKDHKPLITDEKAKKERREYISAKKIEIYNKTKDWSKVEEWLEKNGVYVLDSAVEQPSGDVGIMSSSSNARCWVSLYWDEYTGEINFAGTYEWKTDSVGKPYWYNDLSTTSTVGGCDGLGLWFEKSSDLRMVDYSQQYYTWSFGGDLENNTSDSDDWDANGVSFRLQDYWWKDTVDGYGGKNYNHDSGMAEVWLEVLQPGTSYFKASYGHTWNSTSLSSVDVSKSGISFSFSSSSYRWALASPIKSYSY